MWSQQWLTSHLGTWKESEEVNRKNRARKSQRQDRKDKNVALEELFQKQTRTASRSENRDSFLGSATDWNASA